MARPVFRELHFEETDPVYAGGLIFRNHIDMDDSSASFVVSSEELCSTNYCNCIALAAVGHEVGLLGHFEKIAEAGEEQDRFLEGVAALEVVKPELIVLAGGRAESDTYSSRLARVDRAFAADALATYLAENQNAAALKAHWNTGDAEAVNVHVDPPRSLITVVNVHSVPYSGYPGMPEY